MADDPPTKAQQLMAAVKTFSENFLARVAAAKIDLVDNRDADNLMNQNVMYAFISGTGGPHGVGAQGDVPSVNLGKTEGVYLHIKLPYTLQEDVEVHIDLEGYNYGGYPTKILNCGFVGRIANGVFSGFASEANTHTSGVYTSASGKPMLYIYFPSIYYTTFSVTAWCDQKAKKIKSGQMQGRVSLSTQVDF